MADASGPAPTLASLEALVDAPTSLHRPFWSLPSGDLMRFLRADWNRRLPPLEYLRNRIRDQRDLLADSLHRARRPGRCPVPLSANQRRRYLPALSTAPAQAFRRNLGVLASRYLWIVSRYDDEQLCVSIKASKHHSTARRAELGAAVVTEQWQWIAAVHIDAPDSADVDHATREWKRPRLDPDWWEWVNPHRHRPELGVRLDDNLSLAEEVLTAGRGKKEDREDQCHLLPYDSPSLHCAGGWLRARKKGSRGGKSDCSQIKLSLRHLHLFQPVILLDGTSVLVTVTALWGRGVIKMAPGTSEAAALDDEAYMDPPDQGPEIKPGREQYPLRLRVFIDVKTNHGSYPRVLRMARRHPTSDSELFDWSQLAFRADVLDSVTFTHDDLCRKFRNWRAQNEGDCIFLEPTQPAPMFLESRLGFTDRTGHIKLPWKRELEKLRGEKLEPTEHVTLDARHPLRYPSFVRKVDVIFADLARPDQNPIVGLNAQRHLKVGGGVVVCVDAKCAEDNVTPGVVYVREQDKLRAENIKPTEWARWSHLRKATAWSLDDTTGIESGNYDLSLSNVDQRRAAASEERKDQRLGAFFAAASCFRVFSTAAGRLRVFSAGAGRLDAFEAKTCLAAHPHLQRVIPRTAQADRLARRVVLRRLRRTPAFCALPAADRATVAAVRGLAVAVRWWRLRVSTLWLRLHPPPGPIARRRPRAAAEFWFAGVSALPGSTCLLVLGLMGPVMAKASVHRAPAGHRPSFHRAIGRASIADRVARLCALRILRRTAAFRVMMALEQGLAKVASDLTLAVNRWRRRISAEWVRLRPLAQSSSCIRLRPDMPRMPRRTTTTGNHHHCAVIAHRRALRSLRRTW
ncbi:MAG: Small subunit processome complex component [Phylliscum demangeonii]|nr:MAG: Small subunit processome complex component [Phylliscum demangeonii]